MFLYSASFDRRPGVKIFCTQRKIDNKLPSGQRKQIKTIMYRLRTLRNIKRFTRCQSIAASSCQQNSEPPKHKFRLSKPVVNEKYLLDETNIESISDNIKLRKGVGDIYLVHELKSQLQHENLSSDIRKGLNEKLQEALTKIPNETHQDVRNYGEDPKVVAYYNEKPEFQHQPIEFSEICKKMNMLRTDYLGNFAGHKSFYLMNDLAELVSWKNLMKLQLQFN